MDHTLLRCQHHTHPTRSQVMMTGDGDCKEAEGPGCSRTRQAKDWKAARRRGEKMTPPSDATRGLYDAGDKRGKLSGSPFVLLVRARFHTGRVTHRYVMRRCTSSPGWGIMVFFHGRERCLRRYFGLVRHFGGSATLRSWMKHHWHRPVRHPHLRYPVVPVTLYVLNPIRYFD